MFVVWPLSLFMSYCCLPVLEGTAIRSTVSIQGIALKVCPTLSLIYFMFVPLPIGSIACLAICLLCVFLITAWIYCPFVPLPLGSIACLPAVSWIYWKFVLLYLGSIVCFPITTCCRLLIKLPSYLTVIITNSLSYGIFADAVWKCYFYSIELNFNPNKCHFLLKAVIAVR